MLGEILCILHSTCQLRRLGLQTGITNPKPNQHFYQTEWKFKFNKKPTMRELADLHNIGSSNLKYASGEHGFE